MIQADEEFQAKAVALAECYIEQKVKSGTEESRYYSVLGMVRSTQQSYVDKALEEFRSLQLKRPDATVIALTNASVTFPQAMEHWMVEDWMKKASPMGFSLDYEFAQGQPQASVPYCSGDPRGTGPPGEGSRETGV